MKFTVKIVLLFILFRVGVTAQNNNEKNFSFIVKENYTSTSRLYLSPKSTDEVERNSSYDLDKIFSPAIEIRYRVAGRLFLGLNVEYINKTRKGIFLNVIEKGGVEYVEIEDGYKIIPVELSVLYQLPFSSDIFKVLISGGGAFYIGNHVRKLGDLQISNKNRKFAYGIQVGVDFEYVINSFFSLNGELKFRDPEVNLTTSYDNQTVQYGPRTLTMGKDHFDSKINIDGITYSLGFKITL